MALYPRKSETFCSAKMAMIVEIESVASFGIWKRRAFLTKINGGIVFETIYTANYVHTWATNMTVTARQSLQPSV